MGICSGCGLMHNIFSRLCFTFLFLSIVLFSSPAYLAEVQKGPAKNDKLWYKNSLQSGPVQLIVSIPDQRMSVYRNGTHLIETRVSSGRPGHNTPSGVFSILEKRKTHFSNLYDNAPMPFMQRLTWSGVALHAGNVSRRFASHGCIRLPYNFAQKLFRMTGRGAHVLITNEKVAPKEIEHQNLIAPTPRLVRVNEGVVEDKTGLTKPAHADVPDGTEVLYKRVPTPAEEKLEQLKDERSKAKKELAETKGLLKTQKAEAGKRWKIYSKEKTKAASLAYKYSQLMKQIGWAGDKVAYAKRISKGKHAKAQSWLEITEKRLATYQDRLAEVNEEIASVEKEHEAAKLAQESTRKLKKKLKVLGWKQKRILKSVKWAENTAANAKKAFVAQEEKAKVWVAAQEKKLADLNVKLEDLNVEYLPMKTVRDKAKASYDEMFDNVRSSKTKVSKLMGKINRLAGKIKQARVTVRQQKKPLRILLTRSNRSHNVKDIQQSLADLGYEIEKVDGLFGPETMSVIRKYQKDNELKVSGVISNELVNSMRKKLGREPLRSGHLYVRQGFRDIYNAPIDIAEPEKTLGTHFYTVMNFDKTASQARWTVVTINSRQQLAKKKAKIDNLATGSVESGHGLGSSAKEALDRITLPEQVQHFLSRRLTPGSSLVIADKGRSHETGEGTDFIVLAR